MLRGVMRRFPITALVAAALAAAAAGCGREAESSSPVTVAATTTHVADLARNVGGQRAEVVGILPANADPHDYEPRPSDVEAVGRADLVLKSGGDLDLWADQLVKSAGGDAAVSALIDHVPTVEGGHEHSEDEDEHAGEGVDPHWWQDPRAAGAGVEEIRDLLIEADPAGRSTYERNADAYLDRLDRLDAQIADCFDRIPPGQRKLVTTHDALDYYAERYGIEIVGAAIPALTTQAQPSAGETAELVELVRDEGVKAIFPESGLNPKLEQAIADEAGAAVGAELWADTLGPPGSAAATYVDAMASNTAALVDGLTGGAESCRPRV